MANTLDELKDETPIDELAIAVIDIIATTGQIFEVILNCIIKVIYRN